MIQKGDLCLSRLLPLIIGHNTREQPVRGRLFERRQNYMENKCKENGNKVILGDFNNTTDKMDRDGRNRTR